MLLKIFFSAVLTIVFGVAVSQDLELPLSIISSLPHFNLNKNPQILKTALQNLLLQQLDEASMFDMNINNMTASLKTLCEINGGPEAFPQLKESVMEFTTCRKNIINVTVLNAEIDAAKPTGSVDEVFDRYCIEKVPKLKVCLSGVIDNYRKCVPNDEGHQNVSSTISDVFNFSCANNGTRLALFVAEGGRECVSDKMPRLSQCFNSSSENVTLEHVRLLSVYDLLQAKSCNETVKIRDCVVQELRQCEQPTTANMMESLFKHVYKNTWCVYKDSASGASANMMFLILAIGLQILIYESSSKL